MHPDVIDRNIHNLNKLQMTFYVIWPDQKCANHPLRDDKDYTSVMQQFRMCTGAM